MPGGNPGIPEAESGNFIWSRRDLLSLTGVTPEPTSAFPEDDLHEEAPLEGWMSGVSSLPSVKSAVASRESAEGGSHVARTAWLPTVSGTAQERFTNATAFLAGHSAVFVGQLTAS